MRAELRRAIGIAAALGIAVASCTTAPLPPERGGRLVLPGGDPLTLQPVLGNDGGSQQVIQLIYAPLLKLDPDTGDVRSGLAERWESSPDGLRITYWLRPGLAWSDGQPLSGEDYKYWVEAIARSKRTTLRSTFQNVLGWTDYVAGRADDLDGVRISEDGRRIDVLQVKASCVDLRALGVGGIPLPQHRFAPTWDPRTRDVGTSIDDSALNLAPPVSSGPFVLKEWQAGIQLRLVRNERYYLGPPRIEEVTLKKYADGTAIKAALLTGEIMSASLAPRDAEEVKSAAPRTQLFMKDDPSYAFIGWNQRSPRAPWLTDRRVRQALWYGLDVDSIIRNVVLGYGKRVYAHVPPTSWAYDPSGLNTYPYDPVRARALLESAGATRASDGTYRWVDGRPMRMRIATSQGNAVREAIVQIAQEQYREIGVQIDTDLMSFNALVDTINDRRAFDGIVIGWSLGFEPNAYGIWHSSQMAKGGNNFVQFTRPDLDALLERTRDGPDCTVASRRAAFAQIDRILNEEAPYVFLYASQTLLLNDPRLVRPPIRAWGSAIVEPNIETWWVRE